MKRHDLSRRRVLYVCQHIDVGGAEELIAAYSRRLPERGFDVGVVCLTRRGRIAAEIERSGAPFWLLAGEPGPRDPRAFIRLIRLMRSLRPDVVHAFLLVAGIYGRLAAVAAGVPLVLATEANVYERKPARHVWMERLLGPLSYRVIASSAAVQSFAARQTWLPEHKMPVLYNAVDFDALDQGADRAESRRALDLEPDRIAIGTVARLTEQKGHRFLLEAFASNSSSDPRLVLLIVGYGPLEAELRQQATALGIADRVSFLGMRRDLPAIFAALDVFVLASLWEGLPLVVLEAMGAGVPVVATGVGGTGEALDDGVSGMLVPPGDAMTLAAVLRRLIADSALRERLAAEARSQARARFGLNAHLDALVRLYREGLSERGASVRPRG